MRYVLHCVKVGLATYFGYAMAKEIDTNLQISHKIGVAAKEICDRLKNK